MALELWSDGWPVGWALVGRPVSHVLQADGWVEVTRVAVPAVAEGGPRNGCSALYGAAARWARDRGLRILTYTRVDESGASLRGAGWIPVARTATRASGRPWSRKGRPRHAAAAEQVGKLRWCPRWAFIGPALEGP